MAMVLGRFSSYRSNLWRSLLGCQEALDRFSCSALLNKESGIHTSSLACAGHNKWSKVKHIKGPKDAERSRRFAKLSMMIKVAVREGGPNPDLNHQLSNLVEQCRLSNMPKISIEAAIKGADKSKPTSYVLFQARGPGGASLLIELLTDSTNRTFQEIKVILNKNGGTATDGARHCFTKKGVVIVQTCDKDGSPVSMEQALEFAIQAGAEDVQESQDEEDKDVYKFICEVPSLRDVRSQLVSLGIVPISSAPEYLPTITVQVSDSDKEQLFRLLELINNQSDVLRIYDNIE
ncbi:PREDICTED: translational activator of cytochrome c oxidase 1 [Nanorana parkeri]|uniref:translational activator of cytochrome c oxidase 1 n=1 Tax=Nanorana parkeri TaxID=125878 RepID=UPI0008543B7A|nr:PREDICTED: translational activator of cytochrome c oxidase 1 [Nanorana parkeri]